MHAFIHLLVSVLTESCLGSRYSICQRTSCSRSDSFGLRRWDLCCSHWTGLHFLLYTCTVMTCRKLRRKKQMMTTVPLPFVDNLLQIHVCSRLGSLLVGSFWNCLLECWMMTRAILLGRQFARSLFCVIYDIYKLLVWPLASSAEFQMNGYNIDYGRLKKRLVLT